MIPFRIGRLQPASNLSVLVLRQTTTHRVSAMSKTNLKTLSFSSLDGVETDLNDIHFEGDIIPTAEVDYIVSARNMNPEVFGQNAESVAIAKGLGWRFEKRGIQTAESRSDPRQMLNFRRSEPDPRQTQNFRLSGGTREMELDCSDFSQVKRAKISHNIDSPPEMHTPVESPVRLHFQNDATVRALPVTGARTGEWGVRRLPQQEQSLPGEAAVYSSPQLPKLATPAVRSLSAPSPTQSPLPDLASPPSTPSLVSRFMRSVQSPASSSRAVPFSPYPLDSPLVSPRSASPSLSPRQDLTPLSQEERRQLIRAAMRSGGFV
eukprot:g53420.t1